MVKLFKKILLAIFIFLLGVIFISVAGVFWIAKNPKSAWGITEKYFLPQDLKVTWESIEIKVHHISGLNFAFDWQMSTVNIVKANPYLKIPIKDFILNFSIFPQQNFKKIMIHQWQVKAPDLIKLQLPNSEKKNNATNPLDVAQTFFSYLKELDHVSAIENININLAQVHLLKGDNKIVSISFEAENNINGDHPENLRLISVINFDVKEPLMLKVKANLRIATLGLSLPFLFGVIQIRGTGISSQQRFSLTTVKSRTFLVAEGEIAYNRNTINVLLRQKLRASLTPAELISQFEIDATGLPGPFVKVDHLKILLKTPMDKNQMWSEQASSFVASAPIALFFIDADVRPPLEKSCECKIPELLQFAVKGRVWLAEIFAQSVELKPVIVSQVTVESVSNKLLSLTASAQVKMDKKAGQFILTPKLDFEGTINNFQGFKNFLEAKNILIPAPFHHLEGTVNISIHDLVQTSNKEFSFPVRMAINLASPQQFVQVSINSEVKVLPANKEIFMEVLIKVENLQLELPPLDPINGKPRIILDQRILRAPPPVKEVKSDKFKVNLNITVEASEPARIKLLSNYFKPYLPLTLLLYRSVNKNIIGYVKTDYFQMEYLRRKVDVEKMRIDFPHNKEQPISMTARFKIKQTEYTVFINLDGPINKPNIVLSSEPYLPKSEIISVLLYDRVSNQLAGVDAETAGNVQAAMADRAVGLFSLWAFASTPIKSFSYNPITKVYNASIALANDVTADIGTDWEEAAHFELRKRVSQHWILTARWTPASGNKEESTNLVLQWEMRF